MTNILILGSGGREHALSISLASSKNCGRLFIAPGNAGTAEVGVNVALNPLDFTSIAAFVKEKEIGLVVCGPEEPLVNGLRDYLESDTQLAHLPIIGPGKAGAQLEGSKDFSKRFMQRHQIPTASYQTFNQSQLEEALAYVAQHPLPVVLKADGLAAGKGVIICTSTEDALHHTQSMLKGAFGAASSTLVIESFLTGTELSVFALTDGQSYVLLPEAKDYKRIFEADQGPNTGGMGAVSPVPFFKEDFKQEVISKIIEPTIAGLKKEGIPYTGFLFFGLINQDGAPYVIEYNARLGDPETEAILPRLDEDLLELCLKAASGQLVNREARVKPEFATTVMMVSEGYPGDYEKGKQMHFQKWANSPPSVWLMHAGTKQSEAGVLTNGGRVLAVTALGQSIGEAREKAYAGVRTVEFEGKKFRTDIGLDLV